MIRRLFTFFAAISFFLFVAVCVLWVRSYWTADWVYGRAVPGEWRRLAVSVRGTVRVMGGVARGPSSTRWTSSPAVVLAVRAPFPSEMGVRSHIAFAGFSWFRTDGGTASVPGTGISPVASARVGQITTYPASQLVLPDWMLAAAFAVLPAIWLRRWWRRVPEGHCAKCGYDLRASPEQCPECGTMTGDTE